MPNHEPLLVSDALLQQAEQMCKLRLAKDPENQPALASLAQLYRKQGKLGEATAVYTRLRQLNPSDRDVEYMQAVLTGTDLPPRVRPAPFVLLKNFLPPSFHETLLPLVLANKDKLTPAKVGNNEYRPETRESLEVPGKWEERERFREHVAEVLPEVTKRLQVAAFEVDHVEAKLRIYLDGHFFRLHMDCPPNSEQHANRRVSFVYFFHKLPRAYTGGGLLLFDTDIEANKFTTANFTRVEPEDNTIVFFPSACYHSVVAVSCPSKELANSRFVINGHVNRRVAGKPAADAPSAGNACAVSPPSEAVSVANCIAATHS